MLAMKFLELIEWTAVALNVIYVILAAMGKKSCWIFGGLGSLLSVYLFQHEEVRLYSEAGLYFFYVIMAIYGYYTWGRENSLKINERSVLFHLALIIVCSIAAYGLSYITSSFTDAARPVEDSFSTVFSIAATVLTIRKVLSNWIYWDACRVAYTLPLQCRFRRYDRPVCNTSCLSPRPATA